MKKNISMIVIAFGMVFAMNAQEKTAAGLYNDGLALLKEKNYVEGLAVLEEALVLAEEDENEKVIMLSKKNGSIAAANLGNSKRKSGELEEALAFYEKGLEMNPENPSNYRGLAMIHEKQGDKLKAIEQYLIAADKRIAQNKMKKAKKLYKKTKSVIGKLYTSKAYEDAIAGAELHLAKEETNEDVHYYASRSHTELGNFDAALDHAEKAIENAGDKVEDKFYIAKAKALVGKGDKAGAIAAYKMVQGEKYKESAEYQISQLEK